MSKSFLDSLIDLERASNRLKGRLWLTDVLTGYIVNDTLNIAYNKGPMIMKHIKAKEQKKLAEQDRKRQNEAVLRRYNLFKPKQEVDYAPQIIYVYYIDFSNTETRGLYAKHKTIKHG